MDSIETRFIHEFKARVDDDDISDEHREWLNGLYDYIFALQEEMSYMKALVAGKIPDSDEIIKEYRKVHG